MRAVRNREGTWELIQQSRTLRAQLRMACTDIQWLVEQQRELRERAAELANSSDIWRVSGIVQSPDRAGRATPVLSTPRE